MKKIECIIRQEKLKELTDKLRLAGIGGLTVTEVKGFGRQTTRPQNYLFLPKTKIEVYVTDEQIEDIIEVIRTVCSEEKLGSGKIIILPIQECIRVRAGEKEKKAIL